MGKSSIELFKELIEFTREIGSPYKAYVGPLLFVTIDQPEDMQTILTSSHCLDKPYVYDYMPYNNGILNARCKLCEKFFFQFSSCFFSNKNVQFNDIF